MHKVNFFDYFDRVFILHLRGDESRLQNVNQLVADINSSNIEIVDAITPKSEAFLNSISNLPLKTFPPCFRCGVLKCEKEDCNNILIETQVACFQTHLIALKTAIDSNYESVLVLEDDVFLHSYAKELVESDETIKLLHFSLSNESPKLLKLGWALNHHHQRKAAVSIVDEDHNVMANPAYAYNRLAAKLLYTEMMKGVSHTADIIIHSRHIEGLCRQRMDPPLFSEESWSTGEIDSSIHPKNNYLTHLESLKSKSSGEELVVLKEKIVKHKRRMNAHVSHCQVMDFILIDLSRLAIDSNGKTVLDASFLHVFDPLIQSFVFRIHPKFISNIKLLIPKDYNSTIIEKEISSIIEQVNRYVDKKNYFRDLTPATVDDFINNIHKYSKSKIDVVFIDVSEKEETSNVRVSMNRKFERLVDHANSNSLNYEILDSFYLENFENKILGYSAYKYFLEIIARAKITYPKRNPSISIITVTYEVDESLVSTLNSILMQSFKDYELIVLDGSPSPGTARKALEVIRSTRDLSNVSNVVVRGKDSGIYDAMNKAADIARGEYVLFMNAGDRFCNRNTLQALFNETGCEFDFVYGHTAVQRKDKSELIPSKGEVDQLPFGNLFSHQSVLIRAELQRRLGYDIAYRLVADHNFYFRAYLAGSKFKQIDLDVAIVEDGGVSSDAIQRTLDRWMSVRTEWIKNKLESLALLDEFYLNLLSRDVMPGGVDYYRENLQKFSSICNALKLKSI